MHKLGQQHHKIYIPKSENPQQCVSVMCNLAFLWQVAKLNMATRLKAKDMPQPWHSAKKTNSGNRGQNSSGSVVLVGEDSHVPNVQGERKKRGRPPGKSAPKVVPPKKGMKRTRPLPASAVDLLLSLSHNSVAEVNELRRKRQQDAEASGRSVRTISPHPRSSLMAGIGNAGQEDQNIDAAQAWATEGRPSNPQSSRPIPPTGRKLHSNCMNLTNTVDLLL